MVATIHMSCHCYHVSYIVYVCFKECSTGEQRVEYREDTADCEPWLRCNKALFWNIILTGILVGFVPPFMASEAVGLVSVCINISGTVLDRNITVLLSTENNMAICEFSLCSNF